MAAPTEITFLPTPGSSKPSFRAMRDGVWIGTAWQNVIGFEWVAFNGRGQGFANMAASGAGSDMADAQDRLVSALCA